MKLISIFTFLSLICFSAYSANLPEFSGTYNFSEQNLSLQQIQHVIKFAAASQSGRDLLQSYRSQNYECVYEGSNIYKCKSFLKNLLENPEVRAEITARFSSSDFVFALSQDDYSLVNEGDMIQEFEKNQKSSFLGQDFDKIHMYITSNLKKFKVFSYAGRTEYFYLNSDGDIAKQVQLSKLNKKSSPVVVEDKYTYLYEGVWK
ncbi:hypothetical protein K2P97_01170 [bacterium]|nr:hypothetical protein [bacterium]